MAGLGNDGIEGMYGYRPLAGIPLGMDIPLGILLGMDIPDIPLGMRPPESAEE